MTEVFLLNINYLEGWALTSNNFFQENFFFRFFSCSVIAAQRTKHMDISCHKSFLDVSFFASRAIGEI